MDLDYQKIRYKNTNYAVIPVHYKEHKLPTVIDWDDLPVIKKLNKNWKSNTYGFISCSHILDGELKEVFLHEVTMALKMKQNNTKRADKSILHVNRIGLDNRKENLIYDEIDKDTNKNIKKKNRTITLPSDSGLSIDDLPTYVWYMKPNGSHGDRFMVEVGDIKWKTTSSKKLSLAYKLEEAKKYLRELASARSDLFEDYSMNGDYTKDGNALMNDYYNIVEKAGYSNIKRENPTKNTAEYLKPSAITRKEKILLNKQKLLNNNDQKRRVVNKLGLSGGNPSELPKFCYYKGEYKGRGSYFVISGHPDLDKLWQTTSSKNISTKDKFKQLMEFYDEL
jgi:hypothetical protein